MAPALVSYCQKTDSTTKQGTSAKEKRVEYLRRTWRILLNVIMCLRMFCLLWKIEGDWSACGEIAVFPVEVKLSIGDVAIFTCHGDAMCWKTQFAMENLKVITPTIPRLMIPRHDSNPRARSTAVLDRQLHCHLTLPLPLLVLSLQHIVTGWPIQVYNQYQICLNGLINCLQTGAK